MRNLIFIVILLWGPGTLLHAQQDTAGYKKVRLVSGEQLDSAARDTLNPFEDLFEKEEPLRMTLVSDIRNLKRHRKKEEYQPAGMTCLMHDSILVTHPVRIRARGNFRRDNCTVPPFFLNIRYAGMKNHPLGDIRRVKTVVRCRHARQYEDYVLREYLVYKLYSLLTDYSFRVRLIELTTVDTGKRNKDKNTRTDWAFFIEPEELMAERLNGHEIESDRLSMQMVNRKKMDLMAMFQYMIGNGDYSVTGRHNLKIVSVANEDATGFVPVPYDFDYTGLVNAHYAVPGEGLPVKTVRERYFLGPCRSVERFREIIDIFLDHEEEIATLIRDFEYLDEDEKNDMINYLATFFLAVENDDFIERQIISTCRSYDNP